MVESRTRPWSSLSCFETTPSIEVSIILLIIRTANRKAETLVQLMLSRITHLTATAVAAPATVATTATQQRLLWLPLPL